MLPFAASAYTKVFTTGNDSIRRVFMKPYYSAFHIFLSFLNNLNVDNIPGDKHRYKNYKIINPCQCISFCSYISYPDLFEHWQFSSSSHLFLSLNFNYTHFEFLRLSRNNSPSIMHG